MFALSLAFAAVLAAAPPPTQDFDKDGVVDLEDDCPTDPGNPKNKGCPGELAPPPPPVEPGPEIEVAGDRLDITEQIHFRTGSASVDPKSFDLLRRIAQAIKGLPAEKNVSIEGHTDNRGKRRSNEKLSQSRAEAVIAHLVRHGVERERLSAKGHGPSKPIASNATEDGRAKNRRVEFIIVE
jgi:outer membrane protein OmpA-like peptidoglycan-associated protein